ncbi:hypothetical protein AAG747_25820 [Rapidithrix thailandica]|uniref:Uncharacterized protein n=1 Tax=Rapidithrix thailandica TaxID=413964 RepID=A0AAW9SHT1_9BACT
MKYEKLYFSIMKSKGYDADQVGEALDKLNLDFPEEKLYQIKSAIVFLSNFEREVPGLVEQANRNYQSVLNAATVKE